MSIIRKRPLIASFPDAYKSWLARERRFWSAHVKVDYDRGRNPLRVHDLRALAAAVFESRSTGGIKRVLVFSTRKGWHLRAWCRNEPRVALILRLQAAANDDPVRQKFNRGRVRRGEAGFNVLWNCKFRNGTRIMEEKIDTRWTEIAKRVLIDSQKEIWSPSFEPNDYRRWSRPRVDRRGSVWKAPIDRFRRNVDTSGGSRSCHPWKSTIDINGYGQFSVDSKNRKAHRVSWILFHKRNIPIGKIVMHKCDNPLCVNPRHLTLGTLKDNTHDMMRKGRHRIWRGTRVHTAVLSEKNVIELRRRVAAGESRHSLAKEFGVSQPTVGNAVRGFTWSHLKGGEIGKRTKKRQTWKKRGGS